MSETHHRRDGTDAQARHARRAALYGYASTALQYPDRETVGDLTDAETAAAVREAAAVLDLGDELAALQRAAETTSRDALAATYDGLFGIPGDDGTYPVVPYEANYTTGAEINEIQRRIATVVGLLAEFGLQLDSDFDERQDHVAVELELLAVVAAQRAVALDEGEEAAARRLARAEATVLDEHLTGFVPALSTAVDRATDSDFYRAATDFAAALVNADHAAHDPIPTPSHRPGGETQ
ncbi:MAG: molecular chaperone [Haloarculaceae archaeon]